jgi:hypothetical protein
MCSYVIKQSSEQCVTYFVSKAVLVSVLVSVSVSVVSQSRFAKVD